MKSFCAAGVLSVLLFSQARSEEKQHIQYSPDDRYFVGWTDFRAEPPMGDIRVIVVRTARGAADVFTRAGTPHYTLAGWSPDSTQCFISDASDNVDSGCFLVRQTQPPPQEKWETVKLDPFAGLSENYHKANPNTPALFKSSILEVTWLSATVLQLRGSCQTGNYHFTIDTTHPAEPPKIEKLSDG